MDIKDIVLIILVIIVLYLIYKTRNLEKFYIDLPNIENFETSVETLINNTYTADMNIIKSLSQKASNILKQADTFAIPASTANLKNLIFDGSFIIQNKDTVLVDILPKYMVIAWADRTLPLGWALCNGKKYILDSSGNAIENNTIGEQTPDLRGRFILGSGIGKDALNNDMTPRILKQTGGTENHVLSIQEMPAHGHNLHIFGDPNGEPISGGKTTIKLTDRQKKYYQSELNTGRRDENIDRLPVEIKKTGGIIRANTGNIRDGAIKDYNVAPIYDTVPHNNMPPFYVLTYIMKL